MFFFFDDGVTDGDLDGFLSDEDSLTDGEGLTGGLGLVSPCVALNNVSASSLSV